MARDTRRALDSTAALPAPCCSGRRADAPDTGGAPAERATRRQWRGIVARPFQPAIRFDVGLMFPAYRPRSLLMQNFVTTLKQAMQPYLL